MTDSHAFNQNVWAFFASVGQMAAWLVFLIAVFVPLERLFSLHPARIWRKQVGIDLAWYFINSLVPAIIIAVPLSFLAKLLHGLDPWGLYSAVAKMPFWLRVVATLIIGDFGSYWGHRALHSWPILWQFHAVHHSAEEMDWLVNSRAHPFDIVLMRLSGLIPVYLLGLAQPTGHGPDPVISTFMAIGFVWTFFIHSNTRFRLGPIEWLISSPAFHHWHHTNDEHRDRNFAAIFPIFDRVFGTAWLPRHWPPVYGIDAKVPPSLFGQIMDPLGKTRK